MEGQIVGTEEYAGYARVASLAKEAASDGSHVLLLDAGNCLGGSIHAEVDEGQSMVSIMSTAGYDALVPGPLDFIYGSDVLSSLRSKASFPFLAANIMKSDGSTLLENYKILTINSVRIGIIGVTTGLDPSQATTESLTIADPVETVRTLIGQMSAEQMRSSSLPIQEMNLLLLHLLISAVSVSLSKVVHLRRIQIPEKAEP